VVEDLVAATDQDDDPGNLPRRDGVGGGVVDTRKVRRLGGPGERRERHGEEGKSDDGDGRRVRAVTHPAILSPLLF
jgi:hypothetical protein